MDAKQAKKRAHERVVWDLALSVGKPRYDEIVGAIAEASDAGQLRVTIAELSATERQLLTILGFDVAASHHKKPNQGPYVINWGAA